MVPRDPASQSRVWGLGFRAQGLGFGVWGLGFRVFLGHSFTNTFPGPLHTSNSISRHAAHLRISVEGDVFGMHLLDIYHDMTK